jgi:hypothetical protein
MRYIKRINESNDDIISFIKFCFSEFEDNKFIEIDYKTLVIRNANISLSKNVSDLMIGIVPINNNKTSGNPYIGTGKTSIDDILTKNKMLNELFLDIDVALKRIKDKYNLEYDILTNAVGGIYIAFYLNNF